jgi:hypothetical protein
VIDGPAIAAALEASAFAQWLRGAGLAYAAVNLLHLLGLCLLLGPMLLLDLRLLGLGRDYPVPALTRDLGPWLLAGLLLLLASGAALFSADAVPLSGHRVFLVKIGLLGLALANALAFRLLWAGRLAHWDQAPPTLGRLQALLSMLLWLSVAAAGRLIAYL